MKLIVSKKLQLVHAQSAVLNAEAVKKAVTTGIGQNYHLALNQAEADRHIDRMTAQGYTCHIFDYVESKRVETTIQTVRVA